MSRKIGESRLGSVQFATPEPFIPDDEPARERAEEHIKSVFPTDEGTVWDRVLNIILNDSELQNEVLEGIIDERFVDTASRKQLGMIGEYFGLERNANESDDLFRARIKSQLPRNTTTTTIDDIVRISAQLIGTQEERITLVESPDIEPARFDIHVEEIAMRETDVTIPQFEELIQDLKAAGVRAQATIGLQFTHRSVEDWEGGENEVDEAYGGVDIVHIDENEDEADTVTTDGWTRAIDEDGDTIGGGYADEITAQFT